MDKAEFIENAPAYYALAIVMFMQKQATATKASIVDHYSERDQYGTTVVMALDPIWPFAIAWLKKRNMLLTKKGAFGPEIFTRGRDFERCWEELARTTEPFNLVGAYDNSFDYIMRCMSDMNVAFAELNLGVSDFSEPDTEWEPVPLDRNKPEAQEAVKKLNEAIKIIREDNGYAANQPDERALVVGSLQLGVAGIESGSVSAGLLRDTWNRLNTVGRRFAGNAIGIVVEGAKQALIALVKSEGSALLQALINLFH